MPAGFCWSHGRAARHWPVPGLLPCTAPARPSELGWVAPLWGPTRHLLPHCFPSQHLPHWAAVANHPGSVQPDRACPPLAPRGQLTLGAGQASDAAGAATGSCWAQPHPGSCSCKHLVPQANARALPPSQRPPSAKIPGSGLTPCALTLQQVASPAMERASPGGTTQALASLLPAGVLPACTQHGAGAQQSYTGLGERWACSFPPHPRSHGSLAWNLTLGPSHLHTALETRLRPPARSALASPTRGPLAPWATPGWHCPVIGWSFLLAELQVTCARICHIVFETSRCGPAGTKTAKHTSAASPSLVRGPREHRPAGWGSGAALRRVGVQGPGHLCSLPPFLLRLLQLSSPGGQRGDWGSGPCHAE